MPDEKIKLSEVPCYLRDEFGVSVSYRRLYTAVLDGKVPAGKDASGTRWLIDAKELPKIAKALKPVNVEDLSDSHGFKMKYV